MDLSNLFWPELTRSPTIPVHIVCGPPASGKSTWVAAHVQPDDAVIDLDDIVKSLGGQSPTDDWSLRRRALLERNKQLAELANKRTGEAWFITTAPTGGSRERWARLLRARLVYIFLTPKEVCAKRIKANTDRAKMSESQNEILDRWWERYYPSPLDIEVMSWVPEAASRRRS